ncbi:MAG TPA: fumarylacetoacetate hydrolase family protein [Methylovirgula sp.]|nr:fumarylacetoacetate hydrolase family protein [Methylovirgula sp.]
MRLVRYGEKGKEKPGLIDAEGKIRDVSAIVPDFGGAYLARKYLSKLARVEPPSLPLVRGQPRLGAPVAKPGNFIGIGLNYGDHAKETGAPIPKEPILFSKAPNCISGPHDPIIMPKGGAKLDFEVELAIIIGEHASYVADHDALDHIAGFCLANDVSERAFQLERGGQWMKGKSAPTFGPLGPWLVTGDAIPDVQGLNLWLDVNGERMQTGNTDTMIFDVKQIVSYVSHFMELEPGDVIVTGTPSGVGMARKPPRFLKVGDVITLGGDHLGDQRQEIVAWKAGL